MFDLLIHGAQVIDGTGQPAYRADVAVTNDRISGVGLNLNEPARRTIDAAGLTVIPGIIDAHSHADLILPLSTARQSQLLRCKLAQGVTTVVVGNCGLGCTPLAGDAEAILRGVNAWMTPEPLEWNWRDVGSYLRRLSGNGLTLNVGALVPHGPIRISIMGLAKGAPASRQLDDMKTLTRKAMEDGALGLSTGLIYPPGMYSAPAELSALASIVAEYDGIYTSHIRGSSETLLPAVDELMQIARDTGVRVHHSHNEAVGKAHWQKIDRVLEIEELAASEGRRVSFDMFPYTAAATMMIAIYPPWSLEGGVDKLIERLRQPEVRARIARDIEHRIPSWPPWEAEGWPHNLVEATSWHAIRIGYVASSRNKRYEQASLEELGRQTGKKPFDAISDLIIEERGQVSMVIFEVSGEREERNLLAKYVRHHLGGFCSDAEDYGRGLPHPAAYGAFARIFARFVREDGVIRLEEAVRKMTSRPAALFGLKDRGRVRAGAYADLAIFNPLSVADKASFEKPRVEATGVSTVVINGKVVFDSGRVTDSNAGVAIRRQR
jgi:N-acyl-D-aspartate/D-glutamate deacylase